MEQGGAGGGLSAWRPQGRSFCFGSANVCLLPDSLARFNNLSDTQRRAREVGLRIRSGASRPQIKIYIDSPTNTSISAASFSSLAAGFRRTSSIDQRPENAPSAAEAEPDCPLHPNGEPGSAECPVHPPGTAPAPDCPLHSGGTGDEQADCPLHSVGGQNTDCPLHPVLGSGVQISISAPEPDPPLDEEEEAGKHPGGGEGGGDNCNVNSRTASRESLTRFHGDGDGGGCTGAVSSNNTLSHRTSGFKRPTGRKRRHGEDGFDHEISAFFPANLDFLCLQEVFDHTSTSRLRSQLHRYFPFVLSDVGSYGWRHCCSHFKFLNSGLLLASRYPILDAHYECYPNGRAEDALAAKGVLFAKVSSSLSL